MLIYYAFSLLPAFAVHAQVYNGCGRVLLEKIANGFTWSVISSGCYDGDLNIPISGKLYNCQQFPDLLCRDRIGGVNLKRNMA